MKNNWNRKITYISEHGLKEYNLNCIAFGNIWMTSKLI